MKLDNFANYLLIFYVLCAASTVQKEVAEHHDIMNEAQEHNNPVDDEHAVVDKDGHLYDFDDTHDYEVIFSLMIISIAQL